MLRPIMQRCFGKPNRRPTRSTPRGSDTPGLTGLA